MTYLTPAEKLTTGKNKLSRLKFSNMPWTGCPLIRKEILGTLRSKQQLTTSSAARTWWLGVATWRETRPAEIQKGFNIILYLLVNILFPSNAGTVYFTWPEVKPVEAVGVEVISNPVAPPAFPSTRVRTVALRQGPAHPQVVWLSREERLHFVHHHLKIPLLVLSGSFAGSKEDVGSHAEGVSQTNSGLSKDVLIIGLQQRNRWHEAV